MYIVDFLKHYNKQVHVKRQLVNDFNNIQFANNGVGQVRRPYGTCAIRQ